MRLMQLGLMNNGGVQRDMRRQSVAAVVIPKSSASTKKRKIDVPLEPTRRSARSRRGKHQGDSDATRSISAALKEEADKLEDAERKLTNRRSSSSLISSSTSTSTNHGGRRSIAGTTRILSDVELSTLNEVSRDDWLEDMTYFMEHELHNSRDNVRHSMDKVYKLAHGIGVQHRHSNRQGNVFYQGIDVKLGQNFDDLLSEARAWVDDHGGDPSRGWLIVHPLKKVWTYQVARFDNGGKRFMVDDGGDGSAVNAKVVLAPGKVVMDNDVAIAIDIDIGTDERAVESFPEDCSENVNANTEANPVAVS